MKKENLCTTVGKETYVKPIIAYVTLEDACMTFTSWGPHQSEGVLPIVEEGDDDIPDDPKGAKVYNAWDVDILDNTTDDNVMFNSND